MTIQERAESVLQEIKERRARIAEATGLKWVRDGYDIKQRFGRYIAYVGPHHTPPNEYPPSCKLEDERNGDFIVESRNERDAELAGLEAAIEWVLDVERNSLALRFYAREKLTELCNQFHAGK